MKLLAFETSGPLGEVALLEGNTLLRSRDLLPGRGYGEILAPTVAEMLREAEIEPREIALVAVCLGPGSFAGTRVGVAFAKGFCVATGAGLVGVTSTSALAREVSADVAVVALIDAGRGHVYVGLGDAHFFGADAEGRAWILERVKAPVFLVGSAAPRFEDLGTLVEGRDRVRAEDIALLGILRERLPSDELVPTYVQPPRITAPKGKTVSLAGPRGGPK